MRFGDMQIHGCENERLLKALKVVAYQLDSSFDTVDLGWSERTKFGCVLSSLVVRDFLRSLNFEAEVASVAFIVGDRRGDDKKTTAIGLPTDTADPNKWAGHLVVTCEDYLIDTTLIRAFDPRWPELTRMMVVPIGYSGDQKPYSLTPIAGLQTVIDTRSLTMVWLNRSSNDGWKQSTDSTDEAARQRVTSTLCQRAAPHLVIAA